MERWGELNAGFWSDGGGGGDASRLYFLVTCDMFYVLKKCDDLDYNDVICHITKWEEFFKDLTQ